MTGRSGGGNAVRNPLSTDLFGESADVAHGSALAKAWDYPPFSVLSARDGWWQDRKRAWLSLGIESELGRGGELIPNGGGQKAGRGGLTWGDSPQVTQSGLNYYREKTAREKQS